MLATIITDASVHPCGDGGWAGRIIRNGCRTTYSAKLKGFIANSNDAELAAVVNTLVLGARHGVLQMYDRLLLQVDNQHVLLSLEQNIITPVKNRLTITEYQLKCLEILRVCLADLKPQEFRLKHVKAHLPACVRDPRHFVHTEMDRLAKAARKS